MSCRKAVLPSPGAIDEKPHAVRLHQAVQHGLKQIGGPRPGGILRLHPEIILAGRVAIPAELRAAGSKGGADRAQGTLTGLPECAALSQGEQPDGSALVTTKPIPSLESRAGDPLRSPRRVPRGVTPKYTITCEGDTGIHEPHFFAPPRSFFFLNPGEYAVKCSFLGVVADDMTVMVNVGDAVGALSLSFPRQMSRRACPSRRKLQYASRRTLVQLADDDVRAASRGYAQAPAYGPAARSARPPQPQPCSGSRHPWPASHPPRRTNGLFRAQNPAQTPGATPQGVAPQQPRPAAPAQPVAGTAGGHLPGHRHAHGGLQHRSAPHARLSRNYRVAPPPPPPSRPGRSAARPPSPARSVPAASWTPPRSNRWWLGQQAMVWRQLLEVERPVPANVGDLLPEACQLSGEAIPASLPVGGSMSRGIEGPVDIQFDQVSGSAHLEAGSAADVFFAQGYVHAMERCGSEWSSPVGWRPGDWRRPSGTCRSTGGT